MHTTIRTYILVFFTLFFTVPGILHAQTISLSAAKSSYSQNESILVRVAIDTKGYQINTIEGQAVFPAGIVSVSDVRFGNSIMSLWVKQPAADNSLGTIDLTGGIPGGFSGSGGSLFSFVAKAKQTGAITLDFKNAHVLLNDGSGQELQGLKIIPLTLEITPAVQKAPVIGPKKIEETPPPPPPVEEPAAPAPDTIPPEDFVPMVSRHESIANNAYFVSFFAVDKDTGVTRYEVREIPKFFPSFLGFTTPWKEAQSPHVLSFQSWGTFVEVKAFDGAGNYIVAVAEKPFGAIPMFLFILFLILAAIILTRIFTKKRSTSFRRR